MMIAHGACSSIAPHPPVADAHCSSEAMAADQLRLFVDAGATELTVNSVVTLDDHRASS